MIEKGKNSINLRDSADFKIVVSQCLFWVPFNKLGYSRYSNLEIHSFLQETPFQKQKKMLNAYEAIQLLQLSEFKYKTDYRWIETNGKLWEHHKPGYWAIITNTGCCSSIVSWFNFIVRNSYLQKGCILCSRENGFGHVINYIYHNSKFYIFDLSTMLYENKNEVCIESGLKSDFKIKNGKIPACLETIDLKYFVLYHSRLEKIRGINSVYFLIEDNDYIPPINLEKAGDGVIINFSFRVKALNDNTKIRYRSIEGPNSSPLWSTEDIT